MTDGDRVAAARRVRPIVRALERAYGPQTWRSRASGLDVLIATILSQNTTGRNSQRALRQLKRRFRRWQQCLQARPEEIAAAIRVGGLGRQKARWIKAILQRLSAERGRLSLGFLARWPTERARRWLVGLEGVGPKTAACVLLFGYGRAVLPVDTHVYRLCRRLGLIERGVSVEAAHTVLEAICPEDLVYAFHVLLVRHGRAVCRAVRPACRRCVLEADCLYRQQRGRLANLPARQV